MANRVAAVIAPELPAKLHVHEVPLSMLPEGTAGYPKLVVIKDAQGRVVTSTASFEDPGALNTSAERERAALAGKVSFANVEIEERSFRLVYYPLTAADGRRFVLLVAQPRGPLQHALSLLAARLIMSLLAAAGAAAIGARSLAALLTRPLDTISEAVAKVGQDDLSRRVPDTADESELHRLASRLNDMLARIEHAFLAQRRFVSDASHELRTPLANLRGTIEVELRRPRSAESLREALSSVLPEIERLGRLVDALLTLSRADAGRLTLEYRPVNIAVLVGEAVEFARVRARERDITLRVHCENPLRAVVDGDRLRQIVDNLLDNAVFHSRVRSVIVVVASCRQDELRIAVSDQGPGLEREEAERVFDRFFRVDAARSRTDGGAGLGLAIVRTITEAHGGTVGVRSVPGEGATFEVSLPSVP